MKRLTPFGVLLIFGVVGLPTHKFGLWLSFGLVAALFTSAARNKPAAAPTAGDGTGVPPGAAPLSTDPHAHGGPPTDSDERLPAG
ncbi:hypothetical protein [Sphingomonas rubra]|uniref:Uncharacterized protein n=1 Tax=Sphingomonas rubra TaxID=634430 RepID=A0A1I5PKM7_9SPHN|nr:hypothetical protein [Sphingomonas rubra]SFP34086.1 hypothetical protein SAMN04488241_10147 [Sphingomonas rubra]